MEAIIDEVVSDQEIRKAREAYEAANTDDKSSYNQAKFQYAYVLLKSQNSKEISLGIGMLEDLYYKGEENARRDYLYYIAIGQTRLHNYKVALDCIEHFLKYESENRQALDLKDYINKKLTKEGLIGMAIAGGSVLAVGGLLGMLLSKK